MKVARRKEKQRKRERQRIRECRIKKKGLIKGTWRGGKRRESVIIIYDESKSLFIYMVHQRETHMLLAKREENDV